MSKNIELGEHDEEFEVEDDDDSNDSADIEDESETEHDSDDQEVLPETSNEETPEDWNKKLEHGLILIFVLYVLLCFIHANPRQADAYVSSNPLTTRIPSNVHVALTPKELPFTLPLDVCLDDTTYPLASEIIKGVNDLNEQLEMNAAQVVVSDVCDVTITKAPLEGTTVGVFDPNFDLIKLDIDIDPELVSDVTEHELGHALTDGDMTGYVNQDPAERSHSNVPSDMMYEYIEIGKTFSPAEIEYFQQRLSEADQLVTVSR